MIFFLHETLNFTDIFPCDEPLVSTLPPRPSPQQKNCKKKVMGNVLKALVISYSHAHVLSTIITLCSASASLPCVPPSLFSCWESPCLHCVPVSASTPSRCQYRKMSSYFKLESNRTGHHPMSYSSSLTHITGQNEA